MGIARFSSDIVSAWADGKDLLFGALIFSLTLVGYAMAKRQNKAALRAALTQRFANGHSWRTPSHGR